MRILSLLMLLAMLAGGYQLYHWHNDRSVHEDRMARGAETAVKRIQQEIRLRAALQNVELNARGWPVTIDPAWFGKAAPRNPLAPDGCAWMEVANPAEYEHDDPDQRLALDRSSAAFWYNPCKGIVRARIGVQISDQIALSLYNRVNSTRLTSLFPSGDPVAAPSTNVTSASESTGRTAR